MENGEDWNRVSFRQNRFYPVEVNVPAIAPARLVKAITDALSSAGYSGTLVSPVNRQPRRFVVVGGEESSNVTVYAWTLTFGGRPSLPNEYRIQMTSVNSPLVIAEDGPTVLLGYEPDLNLFAGFDLRLHRDFTAGSPSVQIDRMELARAETDGLSFHRKTNAEIAVGIRPDMLVAYIANAELLHRDGSDAGVFQLLNRVTMAAPRLEELEGLSEDRKRVVATVSRLSRAANFRQRVLFAYGNRCAVTRTQLRLVDAAHILPVGVPGSSDEVRNGLALAPTYHRAFDAGLIYLDEQYRMLLNDQMARDLAVEGLAGGIDIFRARLGMQIFLPPDPQQRPLAAYIRRANSFRKIPI